MKILHIVHCIDTEGPLKESVKNSFERVFGILCSSLSDTVLYHQSICTELQHIVIHKSQFNNMDQITKYYPLNKSIAKIGCGR